MRCSRCGQRSPRLRHLGDGAALCQVCVDSLVALALMPRAPQAVTLAELIERLERYTLRRGHL